mmetsp:Transcript_52224/g.154142  ORF Transcript_52224/g.154142 Transcript_52224/m.154142 type:complete len:175 (-) Transcript_52224:15-539(-)
MADAAKKPTSTTRGMLPGIPMRMQEDRISCEAIWKVACNSEADYYRRRSANPIQPRVNYGAMHGFEVVKCGTYISVKKVDPNNEPGQASGEVSRFLPTAAPTAYTRPTSGAASEAPSELPTSMPRSAMTRPKYAMCMESMDHMIKLELEPVDRSASGTHLKRVLTMPKSVDLRK